MKKIYITLLLFVSLTSCDKYLEVEPTNKITIQTYEDIQSLLGASLREYEESFRFEGVNIPHADMDNYCVSQYYTDDIHHDTYLDSWLGRNIRGVFYQSLNWKQDDFPGKLWRNHYENIGFFNTVLHEMKNVGDLSEDEANIIKGETKFLRAWNIFKLLQYFAVYDEDKYGIPLNLNTEEVGSYDASRKSQSDVYAIVLDELTEILNYSTKPSNFNRFYNKEVIHALLAQVYHFKGGSAAAEETDYENAIMHSKAAIKNKSLTSIEEFDNHLMFDESESGLIFNKNYALILHVPLNNSSKTLLNIVGKPIWWANHYPSDELYEMYTFDNKGTDTDHSDDVVDIRREKYFGIDREILKFTELPKFNAHYLFRTADLHLIIAESYFRMGVESSAKQYLEEFQRNRIRNYEGYTGNDVLQEILDERRREFCFEGDIRWMDIVRLRKGLTHPALDEEGVDTYTLEEGDFRLTQPIPLNEELQYNKIEQNPGWNFN